MLCESCHVLRSENMYLRRLNEHLNNLIAKAMLAIRTGDFYQKSLLKKLNLNKLALKLLTIALI